MGATGKLASLSEEQLVDCSKQNNGCNGGLMDQAFDFLETVDVCSEASYPYTAGSGRAGKCKKSCDVAIAKGGVTGYKDVDHSEEALMSALAKGPVSIAIEADQSSFQSYKSGVLTKACGTNLDHGVSPWVMVRRMAPSIGRSRTRGALPGEILVTSASSEEHPRAVVSAAS